MNRFISVVLFVLMLTACEKAELSTAHEIDTNRDNYVGKLVRLEGVHVKRNSHYIYITPGLASFIVLEDGSGRTKVWYNSIKMRCPPRIGASLTVEGRVTETGKDKRRIFVSENISVNSEPPLADNEVRLCQLSREEQQIEAQQGIEALQAYWRSRGKKVRDVVYN